MISTLKKVAFMSEQHEMKGYIYTDEESRVRGNKREEKESQK